VIKETLDFMYQLALTLKFSIILGFLFKKI